jgi:hypothetical protein
MAPRCLDRGDSCAQALGRSCRSDNYVEQLVLSGQPRTGVTTHAMLGTASSPPARCGRLIATWPSSICTSQQNTMNSFVSMFYNAPLVSEALLKAGRTFMRP